MAVYTVFVILALVAGSALAADQGPNVAVIENPGPNFRESDKEAFQCYVCDPATLESCEKRVDCCLEPKPEHLQACAITPDNHGFVFGDCFKTSVLEGPFYRVTRGCGKRSAKPEGPVEGCVVLPGEAQNTTCNCPNSLCNGSPAKKLGFTALATIIASVVIGMFRV